MPVSDSAQARPATSRPPFLRFLALLTVLAVIAWTQRPDGQLHLIFLAVPGDAALIQTPDGRYILIDGGSDPAALAVALGRHLPFWKREIALIVLTSPDARRLPGQVAALQRYRIGRALAHPAALSGGGATQREWRRLLDEQGVTLRPARSGGRIDLGGGTSLRILALGDGRSSGLLLRIDYRAISAVLAHAADPQDELHALDAGILRRAQLIAFPWQRDPRTPLITTLHPQLLVFTEGQRANPPARLTYTDRAIGDAALYHEALNGDIEWISDGQRTSIRTDRDAANHNDTTTQ